MKTEIKPNRNPTLSEMLLEFTRDELRAYANAHGVPRGRNKSDTVKNIIDTYLGGIYISLDV